MAGDRIEVRGALVTVDGRKIDEPYVNSWGVESERPETLDDFGPTEVPAGALFVMGDARNISSDSRHFGFVRTDDVIGRVLYVLVGADWKRIGRPVR